MSHHSTDIKIIKKTYGKIRLLEKGSGFPLLLLHGNGATLESWALNLKDLSAHFRLLAPDLPGFGQSESPGDISHLAALSDSVIDIVKDLRVTKTHVIGNSLGGILGLDMAARYPDMVEKLVVVSSPSGEPEELKQIIDHLNSWVKKDNIARVDEKEALLITPHINPQILNLINGNLKMAGESFARMNQVILNFDFKAALKGVKCPVSIIWGDEDGIIPLNNAWMLSMMLRDAPVYLIKGAGHSPQFDRPEQFNKLAIEFLLY